MIGEMNSMKNLTLGKIIICLCTLIFLFGFLTGCKSVKKSSPSDNSTKLKTQSISSSVKSGCCK